MGEVILPTSPGKQESEHTLGGLIGMASYALMLQLFLFDKTYLDRVTCSSACHVLKVCSYTSLCAFTG